MHSFRITYLLVVCASIFFSLHVHAMNVQPMNFELESAGSATSSTISVTNDAENQLPVELVVERLHLDVNGLPTNVEAGEDWLVFPPQSVIAPGKRQNFRIQWLGDPDLEESQSYQLVVKQVPVNLPDNESGIQIVYNIRVLINVAPPGLSSHLEVQSAKVTPSSSNSSNANLSLQVRNPTKKHALLSDYSLFVSNLDENVQTEPQGLTITSGELFQLVGMGLVQPGKTRKFEIPLRETSGINESHEKITVELNKSRLIR